MQIFFKTYEKYLFHIPPLKKSPQKVFFQLSEGLLYFMIQKNESLITKN